MRDESDGRNRLSSAAAAALVLAATTAIASGPPPDCNENGVSDDQDIAMGTSGDCDENGVPDECGLFVLTESDSLSVPDQEEQFGNDVSHADGVAVIGASEADFASGAVYVYVGAGDTWSEEVRLVAPDGGAFHRFGRTVATDGLKIAVAAPGNGSGAVYVFRRNDITGDWELEQQLSSAGDSLDLDGDLLLVSNVTLESAGVYRFDGSSWIEESTLVASDSGTPAYCGQNFGRDVAIDGDVAVIGAPLDGAACGCTQSCSSGAVYVFHYDGAQWFEQDKLLASDIAAGDEFGTTVDIEGDLIAIGAPFNLPNGAGYVFRFDGAQWIEDAVLRGSTAEDSGYNVATDGVRVAITDPFADQLAFVFAEHAGDWIEEAVLITASGNQGGISLADGVVLWGVAGRAVVVFDNMSDCDANGVVDLGELPCHDCNDNRAVDACDILEGTSQDSDGDGVPDECGDCNGNGTADTDDIANGTSLDFNLDGIPDECETGFAGDAMWANSGGGEFRFHLNWSPDTPRAANGAVFDVDATYAVTFDDEVGTQAISNEQLIMRRGEVIFDLTHAVAGYELSAGGAPSVVIGEDRGDDTGLTVVGGSLDAQAVRVGSDVGAVGAVTVSGAPAELTAALDICVGCAGDGTLLIENGGSAVAQDAEIGEVSGSSGFVRLSGSGSQWNVPFTIDVRNGTLRAESGTTVTAGSDFFPGIFVFGNGALEGAGTFDAIVVNFGRVEVADLAGPMTIDGNYFQIGEIPELGEQSGALSMQIGGDQGGEYDRIAVTGQAQLAGGLFVELTNGLEPQVGQTFDLVDSAAITGTFDVAFFPGIAGGDRFLRVDYGGAGPAGDVIVVVEALGESAGFDDPQSATLIGLASSAELGDFDGDDFPDLAVAIPDSDPSNPGSVLVLFNGGPDGGGGWLGFSGGTTQITVGREPSDLVVGDFDGVDGLDIAVSNAGDDDVSIILNDGDPTDGFTPAADTPVGDEPLALAVGDFVSGGGVDLAVANGSDDTVSFLGGVGNGAFLPAGSIAAPGRPCALEPEDFDDDREDDIAISLCNSDEVQINYHGGDGMYAQSVNVPVGDGPFAITTADLDLDPGALPDLVVLNSDGTASVILNDPAGDFEPAVDVPVGDNPRAIVAVDLEPDGDLDLAVIVDDDLGEPAVFVVRNDLPLPGELTLALDPDALPVGEDPAFVLAGDLDSDGDDDLVAVNDGVGGGAPAPLMPGAPGEAPGPVIGSADGLLNMQASSCPADIGGDGAVGFSDLLQLLAVWGPCPACPEDLDGNGSVAFADLLALLSAWGPCE